jgi:hypothetical protein
MEKPNHTVTMNALHDSQLELIVNALDLLAHNYPFPPKQREICLNASKLKPSLRDQAKTILQLRLSGNIEQAIQEGAEVEYPLAVINTILQMITIDKDMISYLQT